LVSKGIEFDFVSLDGAFPTPDMFVFFQQNNFKFIMRIPRNRSITVHGEKRMQLQHIPSLKLTRNTREKTIKAELYGETYFFTAHKRKKRFGGWETVFLVSNMDLAAKEQVAAFNLRWPQEKINRTTKQKFGMHQCQALTLPKQKAHIMATFLAHTILEIAKNDKQEESVDKIVNILRQHHFDDLAALIRKPAILKPKQTTDSDASLFQNHIQNFYKNVGESNVFNA